MTLKPTPLTTGQPRIRTLPRLSSTIVTTEVLVMYPCDVDGGDGHEDDGGSGSGNDIGSNSGDGGSDIGDSDRYCGGDGSGAGDSSGASDDIGSKNGGSGGTVVVVVVLVVMVMMITILLLNIIHSNVYMTYVI